MLTGMCNRFFLHSLHLRRSEAFSLSQIFHAKLCTHAKNLEETASHGNLITAGFRNRALNGQAPASRNEPLFIFFNQRAMDLCHGSEKAQCLRTTRLGLTGIKNSDLVIDNQTDPDLGHGITFNLLNQCVHESTVESSSSPRGGEIGI